MYISRAIQVFLLLTNEKWTALSAENLSLLRKKLWGIPAAPISLYFPTKLQFAKLSSNFWYCRWHRQKQQVSQCSSRSRSAFAFVPGPIIPCINSLILFYLTMSSGTAVCACFYGQLLLAMGELLMVLLLRLVEVLILRMNHSNLLLS